MTEEKENVHFMIKAHINRTKTVWMSENENDIAEWDKLQNWKIWVSNREKITTLITLIEIKKLNDLFHVEKKLTSLISKYVRCTDAAFEIFILLEIININLKTFYSLDFNSNEKSLQYFRRANVDHAWLTNNKISEYKQYKFEKNLNEVRETIRINRNEALIESIQAKISIILTNSTLRQSASILFFSASFQRSKTTSQRSSIATSSQYEKIYSDTSQSSVLKMRSIKDKISEVEKQSSSTMKIIEINMSSDEKEIEKYNEAVEHKQTLTVAATFKIVQFILIEKRLNHTTMKLFESWKKKIEFPGWPRREGKGCGIPHPASRGKNFFSISLPSWGKGNFFGGFPFPHVGREEIFLNFPSHMKKNQKKMNFYLLKWAKSVIFCGKGRDCLPISLPNGHPVSFWNH